MITLMLKKAAILWIMKLYFISTKDLIVFVLLNIKIYAYDNAGIDISKDTDLLNNILLWLDKHIGIMFV